MEKRKELRVAALTKGQIRTTILDRLNNQKEERRKRKNALIAGKLFRTRVFKWAKIVMFYKALPGEVDTAEMIKKAIALGKMVVVPVCGHDKTIIPCILKLGGKLLRGPYGIWEPAVKRSVDPKKIDLVIVPGLAFSLKGKRLGRGKGYYDRFLKRLSRRAATVGVAFDFQILPDLPTTPLDVDVQRVVFA
ncbi:MAG TPA: 5-formyltetrahydrofolate cyclo-ligase [Candidatus Omnitrophota bacterium]|nr:5-formyltetrahydrofolate cyclo-ligase [Candidatus Omnitrophota bacterium]